MSTPQRPLVPERHPAQSLVTAKWLNDFDDMLVKARELAGKMTTDDVEAFARNGKTARIYRPILFRRIARRINAFVILFAIFSNVFLTGIAVLDFCIAVVAAVAISLALIVEYVLDTDR